MKILLPTPITGELVTRNGFEVDHAIIYPGRETVLNYKDGPPRSFPSDGLSKATEDAYNAYISALTADVVDEYETGAVTARAEAKREAEKVANEPIQAEEQIK